MEVVNNEARHRFEVALEDGSVAFAEYTLLHGKVMFPHTVVPPAHEGQGIASAIARASLAWAREQELRVIPQCTFYMNYMKRHAKTHDLLDADFAKVLGL